MPVKIFMCDICGMSCVGKVTSNITALPRPKERAGPLIVAVRI